MDIREYIKLCKVKRGGISDAELARRIGTTAQNLSIKYKKNSFRMSDLEKIAAALNATVSVSFIDKETGQPII